MMSIAWERFKIHWVVLVFTYFVTLSIVYALAIVPALVLVASGIKPGSAAYTGATLGLGAFQLVVSAYFQVGLTRLWLVAARGGSPSFGLMFSGFDRILPYLGFLLLNAFAMFFGFLLLIVPFVIVGLALCLGQWFVVDANMGPIEALSASRKATKGQRGDLFVLGLASVGLWVLGALMCGLGLFVTVPLTFVAMAVAFTRISGLGAVPSHGSPLTP